MKNPRNQKTSIIPLIYCYLIRRIQQDVMINGMLIQFKWMVLPSQKRKIKILLQLLKKLLKYIQISVKQENKNLPKVKKIPNNHKLPKKSVLVMTICVFWFMRSSFSGLSSIFRCIWMIWLLLWMGRRSFLINRVWQVFWNTWINMLILFDFQCKFYYS